MKPTELFQTYAVFKGMIDGGDVPQELKLKVAQEFKISLPPPQYSQGCTATRQWLQDAVQSAIDTLQAKEDANKTLSIAKETKKESKDSPKAKDRTRQDVQ